MLYVPYMYYENYSDSPVIKEDFLGILGISGRKRSG